MAKSYGKNVFKPPKNPSEAIKRLKSLVNKLAHPNTGPDVLAYCKKDGAGLLKYLEAFIALMETISEQSKVENVVQEVSSTHTEV